MNGLLFDVNITGQMRTLVDTFFASEEWSELWISLGLTCQDFGNIGLDSETPDNVVWQLCQDRGMVLIAGNRNHYGSTSLEATVRQHLQPNSLPVITVSKPKSLGLNSFYTARVGIKMLDFLLHIERYRGVGRLYVP